ncbi:MAG: hypothetical protein AAGB46_19440 [Verrucomicrobiota bacterium]
MRRHRLTVLLILPVFAFFAEATQPRIIVNPSNSAMLSSVDLGQVLVGKERYWENGEKIQIAYVEGDLGAEAAIEEHTGFNINRYKQHWKRAVFSGHGSLPRQFQTPTEAIAYVFETPGAIAILSPNGASLKSVRILPLATMSYSGINKPDPVLRISKPEQKPLGHE